MNDEIEWLSRSEYQDRHGKSMTTMQIALREGRVPGAVKNLHNEWMIPADAPVLRRPPGRPSLGEQARTIQQGTKISAEEKVWLEAQHGTAGAGLRAALDAYMIEQLRVARTTVLHLEALIARDLGEEP